MVGIKFGSINLFLTKISKVNLSQTIFKYWQSRTYSADAIQDKMPAFRVRMHSTDNSDHHHDLRDSLDKRVCDCGRAPHQGRKTSLTEGTADRVNLDWLPDNLLYE